MQYLVRLYLQRELLGIDLYKQKARGGRTCTKGTNVMPKTTNIRKKKVCRRTLHIGLSSGGRGGYNFVRGEGGGYVFQIRYRP